MSQYDNARCPTCGIAWTEHTADCPRHDYRPVETVGITMIIDPEIKSAVEDLRRQAAARTAIEMQKEDR